MRQWTGWIMAAVLAVVAVALYLRPPGGGMVPPAPPKYPKKERYGMAVVVKQGNQCKVAGGPKNHIVQADEKVTWRVINACDAAAIVELTVDSYAPANCPPQPFVENPPYTVDVNPGQPKNLSLKAKDTPAFPANTVCSYQYSLAIQGQPDSGIDPEMDIWP